MHIYDYPNIEVLRLTFTNFVKNLSRSLFFFKKLDKISTHHIFCCQVSTSSDLNQKNVGKFAFLIMFLAYHSPLIGYHGNSE